MNLKYLHAFLMAAEQGSFKQAAELLNMCQAQFSRQISSLEEELDVVLFDRAVQPVRLTPAGKTFLALVRPALADLDRGIELAQKVHNGTIGTLKVGIISSITNSIMPDIIGQFRDRFPKIELLWQEPNGSIIESVRTGQTDVSFLFVPTNKEDYEDLVFETVFSEAIIVALPKNHRLSSQNSIRWRELDRHKCIFPNPSMTNGLFQQIDALCKQEKVNLEVVQRATFIQTIIGLVAGGVGVALLPKNAEVLQRQGVVYRPIKPDKLVDVGMVWRRGDRHSCLPKFIEVVREISKQWEKGNA